MARSQKRHIIVNDVAYRWVALGRDGYIEVVIWPADPVSHPSGKISGTFEYHHVRVPDESGGWRLQHQIVITNRIIRRILLHAIACRYDPARLSRPLQL